MVMAMPAPPEPVVGALANGSSVGHTAKPRRRSLMIAAAAGLVLALLLVLGVCAAVAAQGPTLSLSPSTVVAGGRVLVTADRVPANKSGEIQLHSQVFSFAFKASAGGTVRREIVVPSDIALGDHTVQICWDSSCRASQTLHVVAAGTMVSTPAASTSATPSAGTSPTPGQSPTSSPTPGLTPRPTSLPAPTPTPTRPPTPKASPIPAPTPTPPPPSVNASPSTGIVAGVTNVKVAGANFTPARTVTITITQGTKTQSTTAVVQGSGSFNASITPTLLGWSPGAATLRACDTVGKCASTTISIAL
jgi:hypothetical protein